MNTNYQLTMFHIEMSPVQLKHKLPKIFYRKFLLHNTLRADDGLIKNVENWTE